jgi:hypothetical protein
MIFEANRSVVEDPHWIYPEERLTIPAVPGQPAAQPPVEPAARPPVAEPTIQPAQAAQPAEPTGRAAAAVTLDLRRPVIPPAEYHSTPWLEESVAARTAGRVLRLADEPSTAADKIPPAMHPHARILIGELSSPAPGVGDSLVIVRLGRVLEGYGQVVEPLALVRVDSVGEKVLTGRLLVQFDEARVGAQVLRLESMPEIPLGRAVPVANGPEGQLLEFLAPRQLYGTGEHGFVSMAGQPLRLGDELAVYIPGQRLASSGGEVVPNVEVARARVVRISGRAATMRLTGVFDTSVRGGLPVRLVARLP